MALRNRTIAWDNLRGNMFRTKSTIGSTRGMDIMYVGERCSMVTWAACCANAGIRLMAVAPLPMTTTRLPV